MTTSQLNMVDIFHCHLGAKGQIGQRLSRAGPAFVEIDAPVFIGLLLFTGAAIVRNQNNNIIHILIFYPKYQVMKFSEFRLWALN